MTALPTPARHPSRTPSRARAAFTLTELMVVIVIIGLLLTVVAPNIFRQLGKTNVTLTKASIRAICDAVDQYAIENAGRFPESIEELVTPDDSGYSFLKDETIPLDPWKNEFQYEPPSGPGGKYRVYSFGADGQPGGEGENADIDNLTK